MLRSRKILATAGVLGFLAVVLGAFGAHALKDELLARGTLETWKTAVDYQFYHVLVLVMAGLWASAGAGGRALRLAVFFWALGVVLFCGSLYGLALGGPRWLGPITPLGGLSLLAGWASLVVAARRK